MRANLMMTAALAAGVGACAAPMPDIRMIERPISSAHLGAADRIAEGNAMMRLGNVGLAIEAYRRARRADPNNPDVYVMLAAAYDRMGRTDLASSNYQQAMALAPHRPDLYVALADTLSRQNRPEEARAVLADAARRRSMVETAVIADTSAQVEARLAARIEDQQRRASRMVERRLTRSLEPVRRDGPRLEKIEAGTTMLVTNDHSVWPERERAAPAIALSAASAKARPSAAGAEPVTEPVRRRENANAPTVDTMAIVSPVPVTHAARVAAAPVHPGAVLDVPPAPVPVTRWSRSVASSVGALSQTAVALRSEQVEMEHLPFDLERLLATVTIDDDLIALLLDEGWIDNENVADLRLAAAARADIVPVLHGFALCNK